MTPMKLYVVLFLGMSVVFCFGGVALVAPWQPSNIDARGQINHALDNLLDAIPEANLALVGVIHSNSGISIDQAPFLRWNLQYIRTADRANKDGNGDGFIIKDQSLALWGDYIDDLIAGKCKYMLRSELSNPYSRQHMTELNIYSVDICPLTDPTTRDLIGALYLTWASPKTKEAHDAVMGRIKVAAYVISLLISNNTTQ
jgi:hypothetical protein